MLDVFCMMTVLFNVADQLRHVLRAEEDRAEILKETHIQEKALDEIGVALKDMKSTGQACFY